MVTSARDPLILIRSGQTTGAPPFSGQMMLEEVFLGDRVCVRYWPTAGHMVPEVFVRMFEWTTDEPADTFAMPVDGMDIAADYECVGAAGEPDTSGLRAAGTDVTVRLTTIMSSELILFAEAG